MDTLEPAKEKSNTDSADPILAIPYNDQLLPTRQNPRRLTFEPKWIKSNRDNELPHRAMP
jgi:hypothetical protein